MTEDIFNFAGSQWLREEFNTGIILWTELLDDPNLRSHYRYRSDTSQWYFRLPQAKVYEKCDSTPFIESRYQTRHIPLPVIFALLTLDHYGVKQ